jgi:hypothetical protein
MMTNVGMIGSLGSIGSFSSSRGTPIPRDDVDKAIKSATEHGISDIILGLLVGSLY